jgi:hypothetical protein
MYLQSSFIVYMLLQKQMLNEEIVNAMSSRPRGYDGDWFMIQKMLERGLK